jgi:hypothetical protein
MRSTDILRFPSDIFCFPKASMERSDMITSSLDGRDMGWNKAKKWLVPLCNMMRYMLRLLMIISASAMTRCMYGMD